MREPLQIHYIVADPAPEGRSAVFAYACDIAGISEACVRRPGRFREIAIRRWHVMALLREQGWSLPDIGRAVRRHHTTVLHGIQNWYAHTYREAA